ncbi:hypothetical protein [Halobellus ordinarius]|uniref:hypothetical protein n=1 Tax=Halobellus ordinarius TaxID=3075120 RepID=UPI002880B2A4|nr:hypothetical protein [Halobellus sp. ZY16]
MPDPNHYHCRDCDDTWTAGEDTDRCPVCTSTNIHEVEFDEDTGVAKWRLEKYENDRAAALRG